MGERRLGSCFLAAGMLAFVVGSLCSCAGAPPPPPTAHPAAFSLSDAENMIKAGYSAVVERYVEPLSVDGIALAGLHGFSDIDASLAVGRVGDTIGLTRGGKGIAEFSAPKAGDVDGWTRLTVRVWRAARGASPAIAVASMEDVYRAFFRRSLAGFDPHARYSNPAEARNNHLQRDGYHGIGVGIAVVDGQPVITEVNGRGAARRAGLRVGDVLVRINGRPVGGSPGEELSAEHVEEQLRSGVAGGVRLVVRRDGVRALLGFDVERSYLIPETVRQHYDDGILYLSVSRFNRGTADSIASTVRELTSGLEGGLRGVVIDLRGNPGGLLQQAVKVADLFVEAGPLLSTRGRHPDSIQTYAAAGRDMLNRLPLVILIDGRSASSAELLAAALQDRGRAVLVGSSSFGKEAVQTVVPLPNGGEIAFTWSHARTPSGSDLAGTGVRPGVCTSGLYVVDLDAIDALLGGGPAARPAAAALGCPAEPRDGDVDLEVARRLLDNARFYAAALRPDQLSAERSRPLP